MQMKGRGRGTSLLIRKVAQGLGHDPGLPRQTRVPSKLSSSGLRLCSDLQHLGRPPDDVKPEIKQPRNAISKGTLLCEVSVRLMMGPTGRVRSRACFLTDLVAKDR
jgi:hypothetical protein